MNSHHLGAFFGLRWRLFINQMKRGGLGNAIVLAIAGGIVVLLALTLFVTFFLLGLYPLGKSSPYTLLYVWDGLVAVFIFWWGTGVLVSLQRSETLSLEKFLHLPVSLSNAFLINYLVSHLTLSTVLFLPASIGLILGLVFSKGPAFLLLIPLLAAFLMMISALTYQFQGWLASLMANKRRRQTIIVAITMSMILFCQLPNIIINVFKPWSNKPPSPPPPVMAEAPKVINPKAPPEAGKNDDEKLAKQMEADKIKTEQLLKEQRELASKNQAQSQENSRKDQETIEGVSRLTNMILPPGWLPLGALGLGEGNVLPVLLGTLGLSLIGTASLWRAYKTTVRYYTGQGSAGKKRKAAAEPSAAAQKSPAYFFEKKFPFISEQAAVIALASFRSLLRAPEAKMLLLSPILMAVIFGSMFLTRSSSMPSNLRPLFPFGAIAMTLLSSFAIAGNQFGFDRNGFRVYVLGPAQRSDILLGKNLSIVPLTFGLGLVLILLLVVLFPPPLQHILAIPAQIISMFLVFCILGNSLSIFAPIAIPVGTLKAAQPKGFLPVLLNLAMIVVFPLAMVPMLMPWGLEILAGKIGFPQAVPLCLLLTLLECAAIIFLYKLALTWEGQLLQAREQTILQKLTVRSE